MRDDVSLEDTFFSKCFGACGDLSGLTRGTDVGGGSGEQLSTALATCWLASLEPVKGGACERDAESDCDRKWAVESV